MFEKRNSEYLLNRMLDKVNDKFDKREGSIIYDSLAPIAIELHECYLALDYILQQTFATTADRELLLVRASEFNVYPEPATASEVEGEFSQSIAIGTRFNYENLNFIVSEVIDDSSHKYKLVCESTGRETNKCIGDITPITPIPNLKMARITKVIKPAEDEEDTEVFRRRYFEELKDKSFGGNGYDYHKRISAIEGVGGVKTWRSTGGGRVRVVILTSEYKTPESEFIQKVQNEIDPVVSHASGDGIAPIGHTVTVEGAREERINVEVALIAQGQNNVQDYKATITNVIEKYLLERRKEWTTQDEKQGVVVRSAFILAEILKIPNIVDVSMIRVNGKGDRVALNADAIPVMGTLTITKGV